MPKATGETARPRPGRALDIAIDGDEPVGDAEELERQLARIPDLAETLQDAPGAVKRQVFEAFDLQIAFDKVNRHIEISATVSEAIADALESEETLREEGLSVSVTDIAGARYVPRYDATRIREAQNLPS